MGGRDRSANFGPPAPPKRLRGKKGQQQEHKPRGPIKERTGGRIYAVDDLEEGDSVDFEIWVADGRSPVPLRIAIVYKLAPDKPKFSADISDWNTSPELPEGHFRLALPSGARNIPFAVQLATLGTAPAASGEVKP